MPRQRHRRNRDSGTSTLELTAVFTVLGGISALAVVSFSPVTADAVDVACRVSQETVRRAALAFETQSPAGSFAPDMATLVSAGFLQAPLPDVSYRLTPTAFDIRGTGPCAR